MARFIQKTWPIQDLEAVGAEQDIAADGSLILNGTLANPFKPNQISFLDNGVIRAVSITSTAGNDFSAFQFTVNGTQNGAIVQSILVGPAANAIVYTTESYDVITSVIPDAGNAVNGISVGTGDKGFLPLIGMDAFAPVIMSWGLSAIVPDGNSLTFSIWQSLDTTIYNNGISFDTLTSAPQQLFSLLQRATVSTLAQNVAPTIFLLVQINDSMMPVTDTLKLAFFQQG